MNFTTVFCLLVAYDDKFDRAQEIVTSVKCGHRWHRLACVSFCSKLLLPRLASCGQKGFKTSNSDDLCLTVHMRRQICLSMTYTVGDRSSSGTVHLNISRKKKAIEMIKAKQIIPIHGSKQANDRKAFNFLDQPRGNKNCLRRSATSLKI